MTFCKDEKDKYKGMKAAVGTDPGSGFQLYHAACVTVYAGHSRRLSTDERGYADARPDRQANRML
jgi:hypothetical protein